MVGWHESGDDPDDLRLHETELGTRFALVRMYQQWQLPSRRVAEMINDGRLVLVSHKPPAAGGWAAVGSGAEDAMIRSLAEAYRRFGREVLFSFHHEPHDDASDVKGGTAGTTADYLAAWRRIRRIFDEVKATASAGGNVFFAYSATGSWALKAKSGGPAGSGDPLYPGDDLVDVFAHDRYNWASCRGDAWEEFSAEWAPLVKLAAAHGKPLMAAEFGSPPADGARNDWFRRAAEWLRTDPLARKWFWGFAYFHTLHDTCPWDFLSHGDDGRLGWRDGFRHPYFTGTPFSLASGHSGPTLGSAGPAAPPAAGVSTPVKPVTSTTRPRTTTTRPTTTTTVEVTTTTAAPAAPGQGAGETAAPAGDAGPPVESAQSGPLPGAGAVDGTTPPPAGAPSSAVHGETPASRSAGTVFFALAALLAATVLVARKVAGH